MPTGRSAASWDVINVSGTGCQDEVQEDEAGKSDKARGRMRTCMYLRENQMYPDVMAWLKDALREQHPQANIDTYDTSKVALYRFLEMVGLENRFPQCRSYDICVDVTGIVQTRRSAYLAFVECKLKAITLRDLSQLLGYSRVAIPVYSIIVSPAGIGSAMTYLLRTYGRVDVLEYGRGRRLKVATWDAQRREISIPSLIPAGEFN